MSSPFTLGYLDPPSARLCLEVEKFCKQKLTTFQGKTFLLALSGGADSTALAHIFSILAKRNSLRLNGIYINHKIRPESSQEAAFVTNLCDSLEINYHYREFDAPNLSRHFRIGLEEAGRKGRYALLKTCAKQTGSDFILLAHHLGDLSEDVLMRLIRGAGWPALGGMRALYGQVFRPLLHISRERLLNFLSFLKQDWHEDLSNKDLSYRRNRMRAHLLPFLKTENPSIERVFNNLHELSIADEEFWDNYLEGILQEHKCAVIVNDFGQGLELPLSAVIREPLAVRLRLYHLMIKKLAMLFPERPKPQAQFEKLVALDQAIIGKRHGKIFQFQGALTIRISRAKLSFLLQKIL